MRKYIIGYLGKVFCFCHESRLFYTERSSSSKTKGTAITSMYDRAKPTSTPSLANFKSNEPNKAIRKSVSDHKDVSIKMDKSTEPKSSAKVLASSSTELAPFSERVSRNLEKMLIKLQKSFDPFKLQDEALKYEILKEILECQKLLLQSNLKSGNKKGADCDNQLTVSEIYDEWKVLAMIVDRICFFIYLLALISSSALFFLKENLENQP
jgi:hypothetical protein